MTAPAAEFGGGRIERIDSEVEDITGIDAIELEFQGVK